MDGLLSKDDSIDRLFFVFDDGADSSMPFFGKKVTSSDVSAIRERFFVFDDGDVSSIAFFETGEDFTLPDVSVTFKLCVVVDGNEALNGMNGVERRSDVSSFFVFFCFYEIMKK